jgi:hypothetical protein
MTAWRDRRQPEQNLSLELWEILAEEFETAGDSPRSLPPGFDNLAEQAILIKARCDHGQATDEDWRKAKRDVESALFAAFHAAPRTALCFSGGGVRSATFGLGVLQGLAEFPGSPLSTFDFLSTVSGGGYVGGWFSAWAARNPGGPTAVAAELAALPSSTLEPEATPLQHIRKYCAFLDPQLGVLSADTWMLAATILRNMILNWTILIPLLLAALLVPKLYSSFLPPQVFWECACTFSPSLIAGFIAGVWGAAYILWHLPAFCGPSKAGDDRFIGHALIPLTISAIALSLHWAWRVGTYGNYTALEVVAFGAAMHVTGGVIAAGILIFRQSFRDGRKQRPGAIALALICGLVSGGFAGWIAWLLSTLFAIRFLDLRNLYVCLAIPIILGAFTVAAMIMVGFASEVTGEDDREWWARAGGWMLIVMACWLIFSTSVVYGPGLLFSATAKIATMLGTATLGGIASWLGFSGKTSSGRNEKDKDAPAAKSTGWRDIAAALAGPLFLLLLVAVLAIANQAILDHLPAWLPGLPWIEKPWAGCLFLFAAGTCVAFLCSWFINVNRFSLHAMYRTRLVRTYLGASHANRDKTVNRFIDMDDGDNISMAQLSHARPLHIVNMALNLVGGKNLAWQQRKAESFTASRLRTGSLRVGYQYTEHYGGKQHGKQRGLTLGAAVAISGAAASPNMGYHSSPLLSFVMTLFNARLGWWLANPGAPGKGAWTKSGPTISFAPILNEALGRTTDDRPWVYLSDGGHFENLGLYEMVLRRCRRILIVDGSQDQSYNYEDLGSACRKIRVDFGITVDFAGGMAIYGPRDLRNRYCATGTIRYKDVDGAAAPDGEILYIKACLNGTEPVDVLNYASLQPAFPQQGTDELWFNESQFESYRKLGQHIAAKIREAKPAATGISGFMDSAIAYIASENERTRSRWSKPLGTKGTLTGTFGGTPIQLDTDLSHH